MARRFIFWISRHQAELLLGLRMTVASLVAFALAELFALPQGFFAVITTVIVMHASVGGSVNATLHRLIGTLGGAVWGVPFQPPFLIRRSWRWGWRSWLWSRPWRSSSGAPLWSER